MFARRALMRSFATAVNKPIRLVVIGMPGSGKGTQANWAGAEFGLAQLSTGDILRAVSANAISAMSKQVAKDMAEGKLVGDATILALLTAELDKLGSSASWLLDGFPRSLGQAQALDAWLEQRSLSLTGVMHIDVDPDLIWNERIKDRRVHEPSGRVYHLKFNPPKVSGKDDVTGEPLTVRRDDVEETVKKRFAAFAQQTMPLLKYYGERTLLHTIPSPTSKQGYAVLRAKLHSLGFKSVGPTAPK